MSPTENSVENWNQLHGYQAADVELSAATRFGAGMNDCSTEYETEGSTPYLDNTTAGSPYENSARETTKTSSRYSSLKTVLYDRKKLIGSSSYSMHRYLAEPLNRVEAPFSAYSPTVDPYGQLERGVRSQTHRLGPLNRVLSDIDRAMMATREERHIPTESRNDGATGRC